MGKIDIRKTTFYSGRVGDMVAYTWRGRQCLRSLPTQYTDRQSEAQLQQRALFKAVRGFAAKARNVIKTGLKVASLNAQMTEANYFMRVNKGCFALSSGTQASAPQGDAVAGKAIANGETLTVDYENLILAEGPVAPVAFEAPRMLDETTVHIDFEQNPLRRVVKPDDLVYLAVYCPELGDFDLSAPSYRRYKYIEIELNPYWVGREVHLWGFVVDGAGRASTSQYLGSGIVGDTENDNNTDDGADIEHDPFAATTLSAPYSDDTDSSNPSALPPDGPAEAHFASRPPGGY